MLQTYSFNESAFATTLTQAKAMLHQAMPLPAWDQELQGCYSTLNATRQQIPKQGLGVPSHTPHPCNSRKGCGCDPCSIYVQYSDSYQPRTGGTRRFPGRSWQGQVQQRSYYFSTALVSRLH